MLAVVQANYCACGGALMGDRDENDEVIVWCTIPRCRWFRIPHKRAMVALKPVDHPPITDDWRPYSRG